MIIEYEIPRQTEYNVLVRERFTCGCCHRKAPQVALSVVPDKNNSDEPDLRPENLKVLCQDCINKANNVNIGKITPSTKKRRDQMEMIIQWKASEKNLELEKADLVTEYINSQIEPHKLFRGSVFELQKALHNCSDTMAVIDTADSALLDTLKFDEDDNINTESLKLFKVTLPKYLYVANYPEPIRSCYIVRGSTKRFGANHDRDSLDQLRQAANRLENIGYSQDDIVAKLRTDIRFICRSSNTYYDWCDKLNEYLTRIEKKQNMEPHFNGKLAENITAEDIKSLNKESALDYIRYILRLPDAEDYRKEHYRFDMSGYDDTNTTNVQETQDILNKFAHLGIYDYTDMLYLDFYKGTPRLFYRYFCSGPEDGFGGLKQTTDVGCLCDNLSGWGTTEIIYRIFELTILSEKHRRRRL
jgi:hypothetical protein